LIVGQLYKLGLDNILIRCVLDHERLDILWECHSGVVGGQVGGKETTQKILQVGLWWPTVFKDAKHYAKTCDVCQWVGKSSHKDEFPLHLVHALQAFEKWVVEFIGPINPLLSIQRKDTLLPQPNYLTRWDEAEVVWDFSTDTTTQFIFRTSLLGLVVLRV
jgi:hypothetical protein